MPAKGTKLDPEARARVGRGVRRGLTVKRERERRLAELEALLYAVSLPDLVAAREAGAVTDRVEHFHDLAAGVVVRLRRSAEGEPDATGRPPRPLPVQRLALLAVAERQLLLGMLLSARAFQDKSDARECAATSSACLDRFAKLVEKALGLEVPEHEVGSLADYLRQRGANGSRPDAEVGLVDNRPAVGCVARASAPATGEVAEHRGESPPSQGPPQEIGRLILCQDSDAQPTENASESRRVGAGLGAETSIPSPRPGSDPDPEGSP